MNIGMTVFNKHSLEDSAVATVPLPVSSANRGTTLNPEASVFQLPSQHNSKTTNDDSSEGEIKQKQVHLFMNGDVGKEVCGEQCPTTEPLCQKVSSEKDMSVSSDNVFESTSPMEEMTEAIPEVMPQESATCTESGSGDENDAMNGIDKETEDDKVEHDSQDDKNDDTGQDIEISDEAVQGSNATAQADKASSEPLTREQIKELVGQTIEYFFSRENWSTDHYLLSQMDSDQYVPVFILANCSQFKSITKDHSIIMDALKESLFVQLDEEKNRVRPNYNRCIVILREIPKATPVKEIEAIFEGENCPKVLSCEFVHNDFWYITFETDSDAQKAYRYLRETVKTFKDKPILARIKTKPISRPSLSVLHSCTRKAAGGESRDGSMPSQSSGNVNPGVTPPGVAPAGPGIQGIPNPHPPASATYTTNNSQRMYFATQNNINPPYHNYNYSGSAAQLPTAYFYPNPLMQWPTPNFYDINSFIQYNGLSPRAAFKPPTNNRFNNNGNNTRRNKNRETKFDKNDPRHLSSGSNGGGVSGVGSQLRHNQSASRPHSAQSPHLCNQAGTPNSNLHHSLSNSQTTAQLSHLPKGESQSNINNPISSSINNNSNVAQTSHNSFAQNDLSLASQPNLYTSFSPPTGVSIPRGNNNNTIKVEKTEKGELSNHAVIDSSELPNLDGSSSESVETGMATIADSVHSVISSTPSIISTTISQNFSHSNSLVSNAIYSSQLIPNSPPINQLPTPHHHHHHYHQTMPAAPHRSSFNNESHPGRDSQPQRQLSRGGRRRVSRRDEEMNGHAGAGNGRGSQRGAAPQNVNGDLQTKNAEAKKPFELQSTSFPPLPSADDEVVASTSEEKVVEPSSQLAWSGEPTKFSDVMKGTAKPKQFTTTSVPTIEKEPEVESVSVSPNISFIADINVKSNEASVPATNQEPSTAENTNHNNNCTSNISSNSSSNSASNVISNTTSNKNSSESSSQVGNSNAGRQERPGSVRDERRTAGMQVIRREREFVPGMGRGGPRRERDPGNFRLSGNKENRPQTGSNNRSWREDRADPDGWITKGPRETRAHRDHRYQNQHPSQHNFYESRNFSNSKTQQIVNGDASPPPPPPAKSESITAKPVESNTTKSAPPPPTNSVKNFSKPENKSPKTEVIAEKEKQITSTDGEHKTSWAKMALASKDQMERLSAELKEKEEQERLKKRTTKLPQKLPERVSIGRERDGPKPFKRENFSPREREKEFPEKGREFRGGAPDRNIPFGGYKPREALRPKSPK